MIVESGLIHIKPGEEEQFAAGFQKSRLAIEAAKGFRKIELRRSIENPSHFLLLVWWDSVEDHMQGFRTSPGFAQWRAHIGPHFAAPPQVFHYGEAL
jgi:heme-degrading monooxygenase HmoA